MLACPVYEVAPAALLNKTTPVPGTRGQLQGDEITINHTMAEEVSSLENMHCDIYKIRFGAKQVQYEQVVDCGQSLPEALVLLTFFSAAW